MRQCIRTRHRINTAEVALEKYLTPHSIFVLQHASALVPTSPSEPQAPSLVFVGFSRSYTAEEAKAGCPEVFNPERGHHEWLALELSDMLDSLCGPFPFDKVQNWIARRGRVGGGPSVIYSRYMCFILTRPSSPSGVSLIMPVNPILD